MKRWQLKGLEDGSFAEKMLQTNCSWLKDMAGCPQDPIHHAEGDVLTHVLSVCREISGRPSFRSCSPEEQQVLAWAALLHDVAKPQCTVHDPDGRIRSPGHSLKGALRARQILWELDCPFELREQVCALVSHHMAVFWALERDDPTRLVREIALHCRCDHLATLAEADALGRVCPDADSLLERVELFRELAQESDCYQQSFEFASDLARFRYFQGKWHNPEIPPYEDFRCKVILMSGLPGAGKDTWIETKAPPWPVISLDAIRRDLKIDPSAPQGKVVDLAREQAREHLRFKQNFIWNATNISRRLREKNLSLFLEYGAHVQVVYLDTRLATLESRNREREQSVPWKAIENMVSKWEVPTLTEAHQVSYVKAGGAGA